MTVAIDPAQLTTPYLDALIAYAERGPARLHVPGHKGGQGADPGLLEAIGERLFTRHPRAHLWRRPRPAPPPFEQAQRLAAAAWGAGAPGSSSTAPRRATSRPGSPSPIAASDVVIQRNAHSSTIDSLVLSGMRPTFAAPEIDAELGIAHCLSPETLERALAGPATPSPPG